MSTLFSAGGELLPQAVCLNFSSSAQCISNSSSFEDGVSLPGLGLGLGLESLLTVAVATSCAPLMVPWAIACSAAVVVWCTRTLFYVLFDPRRVKPKALTPSVWTIHGRRYDLSAWAKDHPGGHWAIELGRNRDCTGLFESYHLFADEKRLARTLARFELPGGEGESQGDDDTAKVTNGSKGHEENNSQSDNNTGLYFGDDFAQELRQMLRAHFAGGRSHKMKVWAGALNASMVLGELVAAWYFMRGSLVAVVLLPTLGFLVFANLTHDASHFAVSRRPWLNTLSSYSGLPLVTPPTCWQLQHVVQHHIYTNDEGDVDLYHFLPLCRTSRITRWVPVYSLQWLTIFLELPTTVGHLMFTVPIDLLSGQWDPVTGTRRYMECQNLDDFVARSRLHIALELMFSSCFLGLTLRSLGLFRGLCRLWLVYGIASYLFILNTQGAHLQGVCMLGKEDLYSSWSKRQSASAVNFRPESLFWQFATGGLNMQSLHHVAPGVACSHYADIYPKYKELCAKHGVHLKEVGNILEFFWGFLAWIRELADDQGGSSSSSSS